MSLIAVAFSVVFAAPSFAQQCLHAGAESPDQAVRRREALSATRLVNALQANQPGATQRRYPRHEEHGSLKVLTWSRGHDGVVQASGECLAITRNRRRPASMASSWQHGAAGYAPSVGQAGRAEMSQGGFRCRHAFEYAVVHANGEVVCSIIDGRGDFVIGNIHDQSLPEILTGSRARELRRLVLSTRDSYCAAIGKACPLKTIPQQSDVEPPTTLRYLAIEASTACDLRCLACPVRDFTGDVSWRDALQDGGPSFLLWDGLRRSKQHSADLVRRTIPWLQTKTPAELGRLGAWLLRGRIPRSRTGTLSLETVKRVVNEAGTGLERIDLFNYGEPFLYRHLVDVLRHVRQVSPATRVAISTDGMQVRESVEHAIVEERLLDWLIFSIDGCDEQSYRRYRIRGRFDTAFANLVRFHRRAASSGIQVTWQYVVFRWNDSDDHFRRAMNLAARHGIQIHFDFAHTWGRSRRRADELRYLTPYLKPYTALPAEPRQGGW